LEEVTVIAPFEAAPTGEPAAEEALAGALEAADESDEEAVEVEVVAARAVGSMGIIIGVEPRDSRETEPSAAMISGFIAKTLRVNMTFSTTASYAQEGTALISMLEPQLAPADPDVMLEV